MTKFDPTRPVQTRDGHPARIVCTDAKNERYQLVVLVTDEAGKEVVFKYRADGKFSVSNNHCMDLVGVPLTPKEYADNAGIFCPACGGNSTFSCRDSVLGSLTRPVACRDCKATWTETLAITGYLDLKTEGDSE